MTDHRVVRRRPHSSQSSTRPPNTSRTGTLTRAFVAPEKLSYRKLVKLSTFRAGALEITSLIRAGRGGGLKPEKERGLAKDPVWGRQSCKTDSVSCLLSQGFLYHNICPENCSDWRTSNKMCPLIAYAFSQHGLSSYCVLRVLNGHWKRKCEHFQEHQNAPKLRKSKWHHCSERLILSFQIFGSKGYNSLHFSRHYC